MIVVQNNVKLGIEIPVIEITGADYEISFGAIDKIRYKDFLDKSPIVFWHYYNSEGVQILSSDIYNGDYKNISLEFGLAGLFGVAIQNGEI